MTRRHTSNRRFVRQAGFTLFEALLTLSLSVVLMGLVGFALRLYSRNMTQSDVEVRRMQLVTAVMQMIEDDLRATVHTEPVDTAGLEALLAASGGDAAAAVGGGGDTGGGEGSTDESTTDDIPADDAAATADIAVGSTVLQTPGLIGNQYQIQFDISRLPRLEEYIPLLDANTADLQDVPSDIKTVSYFVQQPGTVTGVQDQLSTIGDSANEGANGGLIRRAVDRAATAFASENGSFAQLNASGDLLAPEVSAIEFAYWDGFIWQIEWNSDELGELPLAIRITMAITETTLELDPALANTTVRQFMHVIRLPMAKPIEEEDESLEAAI